MLNLQNKTYQMKGKDIKRAWRLVDVKGKVLGRIATEVATILIGKDKANYTPHMDMGDYVVVINAKDIVLTGDKVNQKSYKSHSGYPGGFKEVAASKLMREKPREVVKKAIYGMLPDNRLKKKRVARLKIFDDNKHTYNDKFVNKK